MRNGEAVIMGATVLDMQTRAVMIKEGENPACIFLPSFSSLAPWLPLFLWIPEQARE